MYSLFIDTHDKNVVIIIYKDGKVLAMKNLETKNKHSEVTIPTLDEILKENGMKIRDINEVIVVNGPGSFTGERIAVTIAKTIAYTLSIPIRVIDSLTIMALQLDLDEKIVAIEDRNGAFVGIFDNKNNPTKAFDYLNKSTYLEFKENNKVNVDVEIDYEKVYEFVKEIGPTKAHEVKPLYVKGISALNDK